MADTRVDTSTGFVSITLTPQEQKEKDYQRRVKNLEKELQEVKSELKNLQELIYKMNNY